MSTLVAQTISNGTVSTSSANVIRGSARAWVSFGGGLNSTAGAIFGTAFNVSSVTKSSTGQFSVNFTTAMPNTTYATVASNNEGQSLTNYSFAPTTTAVNVTTGNLTFSAFADFPFTSAAVFSS